jgi:hypothetical protein
MTTTHNDDDWESTTHDNDDDWELTTATAEDDDDNGPDDANGIIWAIGMFFFLLIPFFNN